MNLNSPWIKWPILIVATYYSIVDIWTYFQTAIGGADNDS